MIITKTPLRISFTGGGTDIQDYYRKHGGAVVSTSINKYIYITVNPKFDDRIRVSYSKTEIVDEVKDVQHELVRESLKLVGVSHGVEITSISDIPSGTGLGSSSAFTVGLLNALHAYTGVMASSEELAREACQVEIDVLKNPIGKQDQYAAAYGGMNYFRFLPDERVERHEIVLDKRSARDMRRKLMLFYTNMRHNANTILVEQKQHVDEKLKIMDYMRDQAGEMYTELTTNGFNAHFGEALHQGWLRKQSLARSISNGQIDEYYQKAIDAGAVGGKLLGAGGGGFLLFYCDEEKQDAVEEALGLQLMDFDVSARGSRVIFSE